MFRTTAAKLLSVLVLSAVAGCQQSTVDSASSDMTEFPHAYEGASCRTNEECDPNGDFGLYCAFEMDACEAYPGLFGTCEITAGHCHDRLPAMVCGCDGVTYYNECYARQHGVNLLHEGPCDDGKIWAPCDQDLCDGEVEFCLYEECGAFPGDGRCEPLPGYCPSVVDPVCGCDGVTYDAECDAHRMGISMAHQGECAR